MLFYVHVHLLKAEYTIIHGTVHVHTTRNLNHDSTPRCSVIPSNISSITRSALMQSTPSAKPFNAVHCKGVRVRASEFTQIWNTIDRRKLLLEAQECERTESCRAALTMNTPCHWFCSLQTGKGKHALEMFLLWLVTRLRGGYKPIDDFTSSRLTWQNSDS